MLLRSRWRKIEKLNWRATDYEFKSVEKEIKINWLK